MSRITSREFSAFKSRVAKLQLLIDSTVDLKSVTDAKQRDVMTTMCITCVKLGSSFDFGDSIRNHIQPHLMLLRMKANSLSSIKETIQEAERILNEMKQYLTEKVFELDQEMNGE